MAVNYTETFYIGYQASDLQQCLGYLGVQLAYLYLPVHTL